MLSGERWLPVLDREADHVRFEIQGMGPEKQARD